MTSIVSLCNLALSNIGKDSINALTDAGAEARACSQFYDQVRGMLLQGHPWRFAGKTAVLAEVVNDKPGQWLHAYGRPVDCLKVRWVRPAYSEDTGKLVSQDETAFAFDVDGGLIYCDLSPAFLRYTFDATDPALFSPLFAEALSWHLAVRLAMPLTRDPKIRADAWQVAARMTGEAQMADANEAQASSDHESEFIRARW